MKGLYKALGQTKKTRASIIKDVHTKEERVWQSRRNMEGRKPLGEDVDYVRIKKDLRRDLEEERKQVIDLT